MWEDVRCGEGFVAFDAIFYCRKCKQLKQGLYLKVRSVEDKKERVYIYNQKCADLSTLFCLLRDKAFSPSSRADRRTSGGAAFVADGIPLELGHELDVAHGQLAANTIPHTTRRR